MHTKFQQADRVMTDIHTATNEVLKVNFGATTSSRWKRIILTDADKP
jgi:hypothetical protein